MRSLHLLAYLHSAAVAFRSTGGCGTPTVSAGNEAPCCAEDRIV